MSYPTLTTAYTIPNVQTLSIDDVTLVNSPKSSNNSANSSFASSWPPINEGVARQVLAEHDWPPGLSDTMIKNLTKIPIRYFICDDSGSMNTNDGHRLVNMGTKKKFIACTRWSELTDALKFHASFSHAARAVSEFRFLNGQTLRMGDPSAGMDMEVFKGVIDGSPGGGTPLCRHIREVIEDIQRLSSSLRANNQKACVIIFTDGESSDGDIATALRPLQQLPAWVVVRLCTDEDKIVEYWNNIDDALELDMDVLDDFKGEAAEIAEHNRWLTYGEPLHRLREFGVPIKEIDLLDETKLSKDQMRTLVAIIFGGTAETYPHPEISWKDFMATVNQVLSRTSQTWCPIAQRYQGWVSRSKLTSAYKEGSCVVS